MSLELKDELKLRQQPYTGVVQPSLGIIRRVITKNRLQKAGYQPCCHHVCHKCMLALSFPHALALR